MLGGMALSCQCLSDNSLAATRGYRVGPTSLKYTPTCLANRGGFRLPYETIGKAHTTSQPIEDTVEG